MLLRASSYAFSLKLDEYYHYNCDIDRDILLPNRSIKLHDFYKWCDQFLSFTPEIFAVIDLTEKDNAQTIYSNLLTDITKYCCIRAFNKKDAMLIKLVWR